MKTITIAIPCYNEEKNVMPMAEVITQIMGKYSEKYDYEIVFRDNCSLDNTVAVLKEISKADPHIKVICNARNYGQDSTKNTFWGRVHGDAVITLACDFQDPPELIPTFIEYWEKGYEAVCGQKTSSKEGRTKFFLRQIFYKIIQSFSEIPQYSNISGITLLSGRLYEMLCKSGIPIRYFLAEIGYEAKIIPYEQQRRRSGKSSYNLGRHLSFAINALIITSHLPLRLATVCGFLMSLFSFIVGMIYLVLKLVFWHRFSAGIAPILIGMFFLGSIQLLFIGVIGEYVGSIHKKVSSTPRPIVSDLINFEEQDDYLFPKAKDE